MNKHLLERSIWNGWAAFHPMSKNAIESVEYVSLKGGNYIVDALQFRQYSLVI
jgi:hypothetical protein